METWESGWVRGRDGNMGVRVGEGEGWKHGSQGGGEGGMETWESGWVRDGNMGVRVGEGEGWKHGSQGG